MADQSHEILNIADLEAAASAKLSKMAREYYNSGGTGQFTLCENTTVFNEIPPASARLERRQRHRY
jgi:hypothetical protein